MNEQDPNKDNLVDMAEARKRQRTLNGASSKPFFGRDKKKGKIGEPSKFWGYVQVGFFLVLVFVFLQMCEGR